MLQALHILLAKAPLPKSVISTVANYYDIARTAGAPLMFLDCNGGKKNDSNGNDVTESSKNDNEYYHDIGMTIAPKISEAGCSPFSARWWPESCKQIFC